MEGKTSSLTTKHIQRYETSALGLNQHIKQTRVCSHGNEKELFTKAHCKHQGTQASHCELKENKENILLLIYSDCPKSSTHLINVTKCTFKLILFSVLSTTIQLHIIHTLYFVQIVVFLLGEQVRMSVLSRVNFSDKQRFEPTVLPER